MTVPDFATNPTRKQGPRLRVGFGCSGIVHAAIVGQWSAARSAQSLDSISSLPPLPRATFTRCRQSPQFDSEPSVARVKGEGFERLLSRSTRIPSARYRPACSDVSGMCRKIMPTRPTAARDSLLAGRILFLSNSRTRSPSHRLHLELRSRIAATNASCSKNVEEDHS
jgi:hypothetical protein